MFVHEQFKRESGGEEVDMITPKEFQQCMVIWTWFTIGMLTVIILMKIGVE